MDNQKLTCKVCGYIVISALDIKDDICFMCSGDPHIPDPGSPNSGDYEDIISLHQGDFRI